ncbi:MAG: WYL domain-containing protein, partial [Clostridium sp.]
MDNSKKSKNNRVLEIYTKLCQGKTILKRESAKVYGVDERSIQRDIDDIRAFLDEQEVMGENCGRKIVYDRIKKGFIMNDSDSQFLKNGQVLAISKILLESRAFTKKEIDSVIDKIITKCVSQKNRKIVTDLIANEQFHYVEISEQSS